MRKYLDIFFTEFSKGFGIGAGFLVSLMAFGIGMSLARLFM